MRVTLGILLLMSLVVSAEATTGMHLVADSGQRAYGISTGWYLPVDAILVVNQRNVQKQSALESTGSDPHIWVSKYGSVATTQLGVGFPSAGINEKGLVIHAAMSREAMPDRDGPFIPLEMFQWKQYHLDVSQDVSEVIDATINAKPPLIPVASTFVTLHYLVCDATPSCAGFDFHADRVEVYTPTAHHTRQLSPSLGQAQTDQGDYLPVEVMANDYYDVSQKAYEDCPTGDCAGLDDSLQRYIRLANEVLAFDGASAKVVDYTLEALPLVDQGSPLTLWNLVFTTGPEGTKIYFKSPTKAPGDVQWIDISSIDYACGQPPEVWRIDLDAAGGDRTNDAVSFDRAIQEQIASQHLATAGKESVDRIIAYPEDMMTCLDQEPRDGPVDGGVSDTGGVPAAGDANDAADANATNNDTGASKGGDSDEGCSCTAATPPVSWPWIAVLGALFLFFVRRILRNDRPTRRQD